MSNALRWAEQMRPRCCEVYNLGEVPFAIAWAAQRSLMEMRRDNLELNDVLLLLEHPPVYTLGQGATLDFLKFDLNDPAWEVHRIERGGEVTYHCPGQLVGYPILNLRYYQQDLHWYLRQLEEVLIRVLAAYGLQGDRVPGLTGVWCQGRKVAAIGIKVSRWITMHGFALNVCPDMRGFEQIVPCGIVDKPVGRLADFLPDIDVNSVRRELIQAFGEVFEIEMSQQRQVAEEVDNSLMLGSHNFGAFVLKFPDKERSQTIRSSKTDLNSF